MTVSPEEDSPRSVRHLLGTVVDICRCLAVPIGGAAVILLLWHPAVYEALSMTFNFAIHAVNGLTLLGFLHHPLIWLARIFMRES